MPVFGTCAQWLDFNGRTRITIIFTEDLPGGLLGAMQDCSNAVVNWNFVGEVAFPGASPSLTEFVSVADQADFVFTAANGQVLDLVVPAPRLDIFRLDAVTVDPAQPEALTLIETCQDKLATTTGVTAQDFAAGVRKRRGQAVFESP